LTKQEEFVAFIEVSGDKDKIEPLFSPITQNKKMTATLTETV